MLITCSTPWLRAMLASPSLRRALPLNESGESGKCGGLLVVVMTLDGDNKNCNYIFINAIHYARGFIDAAAPQAL